MVEKLSFEFGTIEIYDHYVIATMKEGIIVRPDYNKDLINIASKYFVNKKFGYITNRVNSYSVDPNIYFETSKIKNLVGFAVIVVSKPSSTSIELEKTFFKKPFRDFKNMQKAIKWILELVAKSEE